MLVLTLELAYIKHREFMFDAPQHPDAWSSGNLFTLSIEVHRVEKYGLVPVFGASETTKNEGIERLW
jgi:hypothetical protein